MKGPSVTGKASMFDVYFLKIFRKVRVDSQASFQDLASVVAVSTHYCTVEEFIDAKYDLHIFKIDKHYKALM